MAVKETLHLELAAGRRFRESFFFHLYDPRAGLSGFVTLAFRPRARSGDALVVLAGPRGGWFSWERGAPSAAGEKVALGGLELTLPAEDGRVRIGFRGRVTRFDRASFPPGPLALLRPRRESTAELDLDFVPVTPVLAYRPLLREGWAEALLPLGLDHLEQLGRYRGSIREGDGAALSLDAYGNRDHSWGERDWRHPDAWTNHGAVFDDGLAVHAIRVAAHGRLFSAGFVCRAGEVEVATEVRHQRSGPGAFTLELVGVSGKTVALAGTRRDLVTFPLAVSRSPLRHLLGRPWAVTIDEGAAVYLRADGALGYGLDEAVHTRGAAIA